MNEHRCLGNVGPCEREAGLFLEEGGIKDDAQPFLTLVCMGPAFSLRDFMRRRRFSALK